MSVRAVQKTESDAIIERLLALDDVPSRAQLVAQHPAIAWDEIVMTLTEKVWQEVRIDTHRAKRLADAALDVAQALSSPSLLARSLRSKANALYSLGLLVDPFSRCCCSVGTIRRSLPGSARVQFSGARGTLAGWLGWKSTLEISITGRIGSPKRSHFTSARTSRYWCTMMPKGWRLF